MTEVFTAIRSGAIAPTIALMAVMKRIAGATYGISDIVTAGELVLRVTNSAMDVSNVTMALMKHATAQVKVIFKLTN